MQRAPRLGSRRLSQRITTLLAAPKAWTTARACRGSAMQSFIRSAAARSLCLVGLVNRTVAKPCARISSMGGRARSRLVAQATRRVTRSLTG